MQVDKQLIAKLITAITKINQETQSGWLMEGWDVGRPDDFKKVIEFANKLNNVSSFDEIEVIVKACLNQIISANNNQYKEVLQDFKVNRPIYARDAARDKYGSSFNVNAKISDKEVNDYIAEEANEVKIIYTNSENIIKSIFNGLNATINNEKKEYSFESSKNVKVNEVGNGFQNYSRALALYKENKLNSQYDSILSSIFNGSGITASFIKQALYPASQSKYDQYVKDYGLNNVTNLVNKLLSVFR